MTIDNTRVQPKSAYAFSAIQPGHWGVKMKGLGGGRDLLFGDYTDKALAEAIAGVANESGGASVEQIETKAREVMNGNVRNNHAA